MGMLVVFGLLLIVLGWLLLGGRGSTHEPTLHRRHDDVDRAELEEAEREVQEASDAESVNDWGPGAGKPRPPEML